MKTRGMAWRNVWRNRRRSLITICAMGFALFAMILYSGLVTGYMQGLERSVVDYEVGDAQIFAPGYRDRPSLYSNIAGTGELVARLEKAGYRASPRLMAGGLAAAGESSAGVSLRGLEVARDREVSRIADAIAEGAWLDPARADEVVIGRRLAKTLGIRLRDELVVLTQGADGSTANQVYKVRGILRGVADATDRAAVFMTAGAFRELLVYQGGAHQVIVRRPAHTTLAQAGAEVKRIAGGLDAQTWRELLPTLASMFDSGRSVIYVMFVFVYIAIGIVLLNAMLMAVFERIRELGMLKAIGMGPGTVMRLIFLESGFQTALAIAGGLTVSLPGVWYLAKFGIDTGKLADASVGGYTSDRIWRADFTTGTFVAPLLVMLVIVTIAVLIPAIKAARLHPVEAMRHR